MKQKGSHSVTFRKLETSDPVTRKLRECVSRVLDFLSLYGFKEDEGTQKAFVSTVKHWRAQVGRMGDDWIGYLKYRLAAFVHESSEQFAQGPTVPAGISPEKPGILMAGKIGRFITMLTRPVVLNGVRDSSRREEVLAGIGIGLKKGMPRPTDDYLVKGATKAFKALTTIQPEIPAVESLTARFGDWGDVEDHPNFQDEVSRETSRAQVYRVVREIFAGLDYKTWIAENQPRPFPSTSSTSTSTRAQGGAFHDLQKVVIDNNLFGNVALINFTRVTEFEVEAYQLGRLTAIFDEMPEDEPLEMDVYLANPELLNQRYDELYALCRQMYERGELNNEVQIVALSEALKVRTITKGNGVRNFLLHPLQKFLAARIKSHPVFHLIGEPISERHMMETLGGRLKDGEAYLSGDYSAATDKLAPWFSESIADAISAEVKLPDWLATAFREGLTGHLICDPDSDEKLPQMWGQLMGSIVSFPVLCIANAVVCRWTLEAARRRYCYLNDVKMLINGDDCVFRLPIKALPIWEYIAKFHGLSPSIGKYFLSRTLIQMNSVNFVHSPHIILTPGRDGVPVARTCPFRMVKFVNMGLFYGLGRSSSAIRKVAGVQTSESVTTDDMVNLASRARDMLLMAPVNMIKALYTSYLRYHRENLKKKCANMSWFTPVQFGGLGLPCFMRVPDLFDSEGLPTDRFSEFHRLSQKGIVFGTDDSELLKCAPTDRDLRIIGGLIDRDELAPEISSDTAFAIRKEAMKNFPVKRTVVDDASLFEFDSDAAIGKSCLELLFRQRLKPKVTKGLLDKTFAKVGFFWLKAAKKGLGQKRSLLTILSSADNVVIPVRMEDVRKRSRAPDFLNWDVGWMQAPAEIIF